MNTDCFYWIRNRDCMNKWLFSAKGNQMVKKNKTKKYKFQGQSARSIRWFDLDYEWLEEIFRKRELDFYKNCIKIILGVIIQINIKYLEYQLVIQK